MISYFVYALVFCLAPALILCLCDKVKWLGKVGPVLLLYFLGIFVGNLGLMPGFNDSMVVPKDLLKILSNIMIPLALPLMLFGCVFKKSDTRDQLVSLFVGLFAVCVATVAAYLVFGKNIEEGAKIGGMLAGVSTGGTVNMASLKTMLSVKDETFILLNAYDMIVSFCYLTVLLSFGIPLARKILPVKTYTKRGTKYRGEKVSEEKPYTGLFTKKGLKDASTLLVLTLVIIVVSAGIAKLFDEEVFTVVFILLITTFGILASFNEKVRNAKHGYDIGMYFIYIFSMAVAAMADFKTFDLLSSLNMLGFLALIVFGSLILQVFISRCLKVDADTTVITSVAFINSPPFVPMIAAAMHNRRVLVTGLSIGIVGYAAGNYLGFLIYRLLLLL